MATFQIGEAYGQRVRADHAALPRYPAGAEILDIRPRHYPKAGTVLLYSVPYGASQKRGLIGGRLDLAGIRESPALFERLPAPGVAQEPFGDLNCGGRRHGANYILVSKVDP